MTNVLLFSITVFDPTINDVAVIRVATGGGYIHASAPAPFRDAVLERSQVRREIFSDGQAFGVGTHDYGVLDLANNDGWLDWLAEHDVVADGRPVEIRLVDDSEPIDQGTTVFSGLVASLEVGLDRVRVRFHDAFSSVLDQPLSETTRLGTGGLEGPESMEGQYRLVIEGHASRVECPMVDSAHLIAEVADRGPVVIEALHVRGDLIDQGVQRTSIAALQSTEPASGHWDWYPGSETEPAYVRMGSSVDGMITADVNRGGTPADRTAAQCIARLLRERAGVTLSAEDVAAMDSAAPAEVGAAWGGAQTLRSAVNFLAATVGAGVWQDPEGSWRMALVAEPGSAVATFAALGLSRPAAVHDAQIIDIEPLFTSRDDGGVPPWRLDVLFDRTYGMQDKSALIYESTDTLATLFGEEWRTEPCENPDIRTLHPHSTPMEVETGFRYRADAHAEGERRLTLFQGRRRYRVLGVLSPSLADSLDLGKTIRVEHPRLGLQDGRDMVILGMTFNFLAQTVDMTVWG